MFLQKMARRQALPNPHDIKPKFTPGCGQIQAMRPHKNFRKTLDLQELSLKQTALKTVRIVGNAMKAKHKCKVNKEPTEKRSYVTGLGLC